MDHLPRSLHTPSNDFEHQDISAGGKDCCAVDEFYIERMLQQPINVVSLLNEPSQHL